MMRGVNDSIPSVVDGLTRAERAVLLCAFKNPSCQHVLDFIEYAVEQCPTYRFEKRSLVTTMTGMVQNYPGTNNINLLHPSSGRHPRVGSSSYTFTQLSSITPHLFCKSDQPLLKKLMEVYVDDPPRWLMPVIPMILVNGSGGAKYDPLDIIANLRNLLHKEPLVPMAPRYKWFSQDIPREEETETSYTIRGSVEERDDAPNTLFITELPVGKESRGYEEFLKKDMQPFIKEYTAHHHINGTVTFQVVMSPDQMKKAREEGFLEKFGLTTTLNTNNMLLLDANGKRKTYDTPYEILKEFVDLRVDCYEKRRLALLDVVEKALVTLENLCPLYDPLCEESIFSLNDIRDQVLFAELKNTYKFPSSVEPSKFNFEYVSEQYFEWIDTLSDIEDSLKNTSGTSLWLGGLCDLEQQLKGRYDEDEAGRRKKWMCDFEIEEEEPSKVFGTVFEKVSKVFGTDSEEELSENEEDEPDRDRDNKEPSKVFGTGSEEQSCENEEDEKPEQNKEDESKE